ncbi:MAG TPA: hypothetical protein VJ183_03610 [Chloroflexia bacterium]|nr:hypothetical protein [Chloroflexia bacterium]
MANADEPDVRLPATPTDEVEQDQRSQGTSSPSETGEGIGSAQNQGPQGGAAVEKDESGQSTTRG